MKKFFSLLIFMGVFVFSIFGKPVDYYKAEVVARNFITGHAGFLKETKIGDYNVVKGGSEIAQGNIPVTYFYIFHTVPAGFVIIAGDDRIFPVIGYSLEGYFDINDMPVNVRKWIEMYKKEIGYIVENDIEATESVVRTWEKYEGKDVIRESVVIAVDPLLKTKWNQSPYYNAMCPGGSPTGCTATATAQVMKYWNHPAKGSGFHSYNHTNYGTLSANFGNTTYQWSSMPDVVNSANNAVATLMFHVGVSMNMNYSPQGSNAYVISYNNQVENSAEGALIKYFGYKSTLKGIEKKNYTDAHWVNLIKTELNQNRPIIYAGFSQTVGHAFVCDGYDNNQFFHFNWGWGGAYDGYFILTSLNPGSTYNFVSNQQMIIGIEPVASNQTYSLKLNEKIKITPSPMTFGRDFTVKTNILNSGGGAFNGDFCAAVFDDDWNFIDYVEIKTNLTLAGNSSFTSSLVFANAGLLSMLPGDYFIGIYYKPQGTNQWQRVADNGTFVNFVSHRVYFAADIELYTDISVTPGINALVEGQPAKVVVNVVNDGFATFKGWYSADLYDLKGAWVTNFGMLYEFHGLTPGNYYLAPYLQFETQNLEAPPGTYFLAIHYKPVNKEWSLAGSSYHANPIYVIVKSREISPDPYEPNNTVQTAYKLPVNFSGNSAKITTEGSNCHVVNDFDNYKIVLDAGFRYQITARIHDSYASEDGKEYSADVMFSTSTNGVNWSEPFDDIKFQSLQLVGSQTVYFQVVPFFEGEKGTYLLEINIVRYPVSGTLDVSTVNKVDIYPNPVNDVIHVQVNDDMEIKSIQLYNVAGDQIRVEWFPSDRLTWFVPVHQLPEGSYILTVFTGNMFVSKKIVICH
jgi:hypothetical protein